jgi:hypothetical protein
MRLLQDFIGSAIPEDLPYGLMTDSLYTFGEAIFDKVPNDDNESAKCLHDDIVRHLANTAHLARSPYFDDQGNCTLTVALPAGWGCLLPGLLRDDVIFHRPLTRHAGNADHPHATNGDAADGGTGKSSDA